MHINFKLSWILRDEIELLFSGLNRLKKNTKIFAASNGLNTLKQIDVKVLELYHRLGHIHFTTSSFNTAFVMMQFSYIEQANKQPFVNAKKKKQQMKREKIAHFFTYGTTFIKKKKFLVVFFFRLVFVWTFHSYGSRRSRLFL